MKNLPTVAVVDANVILKAVIIEPYSREVIDMLRQLGIGIELHAPLFLKVECSNVLWKQVRAGYPLPHAVQDIHSLAKLAIQYTATEPLLGLAFEMACQYDITVYDALYLALAATMQLPVITGDRPAARKAAGSPYEIITLSDLFTP